MTLNWSKVKFSTNTDNAPTPGHVFHEIAMELSMDYKNIPDIYDFCCYNLFHQDHLHVRLKTLLLLKTLLDKVITFKTHCVQHKLHEDLTEFKVGKTKDGQILTLISITGPASDLYGDEPYRLVRDAAKSVVSILEDPSISEDGGLSSTNNVDSERIRGYGKNVNYSHNTESILTNPTSNLIAAMLKKGAIEGAALIGEAVVDLYKDVITKGVVSTLKEATVDAADLVVESVEFIYGTFKYVLTGEDDQSKNSPVEEDYDIEGGETSDFTEEEEYSVIRGRSEIPADFTLLAHTGPGSVERSMYNNYKDYTPIEGQATEINRGHNTMYNHEQRNNNIQHYSREKTDYIKNIQRDNNELSVGSIVYVNTPSCRNKGPGKIITVDYSDQSNLCFDVFFKSDQSMIRVDQDFVKIYRETQLDTIPNLPSPVKKENDRMIDESEGIEKTKDSEIQVENVDEKQHEHTTTSEDQEDLLLIETMNEKLIDNDSENGENNSTIESDNNLLIGEEDEDMEDNSLIFPKDDTTTPTITDLMA